MCVLGLPMIKAHAPFFCSLTPLHLCYLARLLKDWEQFQLKVFFNQDHLENIQKCNFCTACYQDFSIQSRMNYLNLFVFLSVFVFAAL